MNDTEIYRLGERVAREQLRKVAPELVRYCSAAVDRQLAREGTVATEAQREYLIDEALAAAVATVSKALRAVQA